METIPGITRTTKPFVRSTFFEPVPHYAPAFFYASYSYTLQVDEPYAYRFGYRHFSNLRIFQDTLPATSWRLTKEYSYTLTPPQ